MAVGYCLDCENGINLGKDPFIGQRVTCRFCGSFLEVVELAPVEFEWAYDDDEDWDYGDEYGEQEVELEGPEYFDES